MARIEYEDEDADDDRPETPRWRRRAVTAVLALVGLSDVAATAVVLAACQGGSSAPAEDSNELFTAAFTQALFRRPAPAAPRRTSSSPAWHAPARLMTP